MTVDRKTGKTKVIHIPMASVSITGGIQPGILARSLGLEHRENGLAARFLLAMPPKRPKEWREDGIPPPLLDQLRELFRSLRGLEMPSDEFGESCPVVVDLTESAKDLWIEFYNEHGKLQQSASGDMAAVLSKLEGYCARLALVIHCVRIVAGDISVNRGFVDADSMRPAIELVRWFSGEATRVYATLSESEVSRRIRRVAEKVYEDLKLASDGLSRTEISGLLDRHVAASTIEAALELLEQSRQARRETHTTGGRPQERWFQEDNGVRKKRNKSPDDPDGLSSLISQDESPSAAADDWEDVA